MRSGVLIDPNFISTIKNDPQKIEEALNIIKNLVSKPETNYLIYRIDNFKEDLKKNYKELINNYSQDVKLKTLVETIIEKFECEYVENNLKIFQLGHKLTQNELINFKNEFYFIKLLINNIEIFNELNIQKTYNFVDLDKNKLKEILKLLFTHVKSVTFFDAWILEHTFYLTNKKAKNKEQKEIFYNETNSTFNINRATSDYLNTINFMLGIVFNNNFNDKDLRIELITSYDTKKKENILEYEKDYKNKNGESPQIHQKIKDEFLSLLNHKSKKDNIKIKIVEKIERKVNNTVSEFYFKSFKIRYKSNKKIMIECGKGINFIAGKNIKQMSSYRLKLVLDDFEMKHFDSIRNHSEINDKNLSDINNLNTI